MTKRNLLELKQEMDDSIELAERKSLAYRLALHRWKHTDPQVALVDWYFRPSGRPTLRYRLRSLPYRLHLRRPPALLHLRAREA